MLIILALLLFCYLVNLGKLHQTKWSAMLMFAAALFVMGWRSMSYTPDNVAYVGFFKIFASLSIPEAWQNLMYGGEDKDPFFHFLGNVFSNMGLSCRSWFVFISAAFLSGFCYLMYKRSKDFALSMFLLVTLGYFYFAMTGLRQAVAFGFCYFAFEFLCRRNLSLFLTFTFVAGLFHSSAWVFFIMYPLSFLKIGIKNITGIVVAVLIALLFPRFLGYLVTKLAWNDHLEQYGEITSGLTISGYLIQAAIFVFCIWAYYRKTIAEERMSSVPMAIGPKLSIGWEAASGDLVPDAREESTRHGIQAIAFGAALQAFSMNIDNFFRVAMYFSCYTPIVIPNVLEYLPDRDRRLFRLAIIFACLWMMYHSRHFSYFTMFEDLQ